MWKFQGLSGSILSAIISLLNLLIKQHCLGIVGAKKYSKCGVLKFYLCFLYARPMRYTVTSGRLSVFFLFLPGRGSEFFSLTDIHFDPFDTCVSAITPCRPLLRN